MKNRWAKLPTWWIRELEGISFLNLSVAEPGLKFFTVKEIGVSIAVFKIYIALSMRADNYSTGDTPGLTELSISELEDMTGMSRAMIVKAINRLENLKLVSIRRKKGQTNSYLLERYDETPWAKIPKRRFNDVGSSNGNTLAEFPMRGKVNLNALKLYLFLAASVDSKTGVACRTYETIERNTGIRRNDIRGAISVLINFHLVKVSHEKFVNDENPYKSPNKYHICDL